MFVYLVKESYYDEVIRHGIFTTEQLAKKKIKEIYKQMKSDYADSYRFVWHDKNKTCFEVYMMDSYLSARVEIVKEEVIEKRSINMKEYIDEFLGKFDEQGEVCNVDSDIFMKTNDCITRALSAYCLESIRKVNDSKNVHYVAHFSGGSNGNGKWTEYLNDLTNLIKDMDNNFHSVYAFDFLDYSS